MNDKEMDLNKADLQAYVNGDYYLTSKLPGIAGQPQKQKASNLSNYNDGPGLLNKDFLEKQKRLQ
jgi:hypothetical protein